MWAMAASREGHPEAGSRQEPIEGSTGKGHGHIFTFHEFLVKELWLSRSWVLSETEPESRTWFQVILLRNDPRRNVWESGRSRREEVRSQAKERFLVKRGLCLPHLSHPTGGKAGFMLGYGPRAMKPLGQVLFSLWAGASLTCWDQHSWRGWEGMVEPGGVEAMYAGHQQHPQGTNRNKVGLKNIFWN